MVKQQIRTIFKPLYHADVGEANARLEAVQKKYGFYTTIINIAESGVFNLPNHSPLRSAELANLYEVYQYLTYRSELSAANG